MVSRAYNKRGLVTFIDGEILNVTKNKLTRAHVSTCVHVRMLNTHAYLTVLFELWTIFRSNDLRAVMDKGERLALTLADGIRFLRLGGVSIAFRTFQLSVS